MGTDQNLILSINAGSSSVKLALFNDKLEKLAELIAADIGLSNSRLTISTLDTTTTKQIDLADHHQAAESLFNALPNQNLLNGVVGIGHRVVHGGLKYSEPIQINNDVIENLRALYVYDPDHMPAALSLIEWCQATFANTLQIACFDTAFFVKMPEVATTIALPNQYRTSGLRRYGFHGLSYEYILHAFATRAGDTAAKGRVVMAHLGSGASLTAIVNGQVADTTMSFSPSSGIVMSTRSGDIDPGIVGFLMSQTDMTIDDFNRVINKESGLLGVSGISADMELLINRSATDENASLAVELFCYQTRKAIGGLATTIGGLDSLIFTGGIGENAPLIRQKICNGLSYFGVELDPARNHNHDFLISSDSSRIGVHVIKTDEAAIIAAKTKQLINQAGGE